jgi:hypothetical protein
MTSPFTRHFEAGEQEAQRPRPPKLVVKEVVVCKGCGDQHSFEGYGDNVPSKYSRNDKTVSVFCPTKKQFYTYSYDKETYDVPVNPLSISNELMAKILEIENKVKALEDKTAELPPKDGMKTFRTTINEDFSAFLADALSKISKQSGGDSYVG